MRKMKDSGIEWIGEIPEEWYVIRTKYLCDLYTGNSIRDEEKDLFQDPTDAHPYISTKDIDAQFGVANYNNGLYIKNSDNSFKIALTGSTLMCIEGGSAGRKKVFVTQNVSFVNKLCCFKPKYILPKFLYYYIASPHYEDQFKTWINGLIGGVSISILKNFMISLSNEKIQSRIADFLDDKCGKIDRYIETQRAIIEKLKAYKQAVITEAVTKGLDPTAPMKDSGVEWIGEIPEGWMLSHIGNLAEIGSGGTPDRNKPEFWEEGTIPWLSSGEINCEYIYDTVEKITELGMQNSNAKMLPVNTVMLGLIGQGKTKGLTAVLKIECTCNQNLAYLKTNSVFLHYQYLFYCFKAMYSYIRGLIGDSQAGIYQYFLKKQYIPLPTVNVQRRISEHLDKLCLKIDSTISKMQLIIDKLTEYKKSLIYEVVTGKKEVW